MNILIFNCGSSSQNFKVYSVLEGQSPAVIASGKARNVATRTKAEPQIDWRVGDDEGSRKVDLSTHRQAAEENLRVLVEHTMQIDAVGHRFVHGAEWFQATTRITASSMETLKKCFRLAPIHNPNSFSVIEVCTEQLPGVPQFVVFDTSFHSKLPPKQRDTHCHLSWRVSMVSESTAFMVCPTASFPSVLRCCSTGLLNQSS